MVNFNNTENVNSANSIMIAGRSAAETAKIAAAENKASERINSEQEKEARTDKYVKSAELEKSDSGVYSREDILEQLRADEEKRIKAFQDTIRSMMAQQGQTVNLTFRGMDLHVTEEQRAAAEKSISEGGEYSIDAVATRIMDMAKALSGGDSSKLSMLREAVQKGFAGAAKTLNMKESDMPQITKDTYTEVMKRFDEWEKSANEEQMKKSTTNEVTMQQAATQIAAS